ncbi:hypothetical protein C6501_11525 [Candidatus Poribacteria bacterium]|nr:MAG: hypothetical protein C6501_11525 [Candidatus Poribacteria bacterium]
MKHVITPVGTSLFTNGSKTNRNIQNSYERIEDKQHSEWDNNSTYIERLRSISNEFISENTISATAELQSTAIIKDKIEDRIIVYLLASDTISSRLAAEILRDRINDPNSVLGENVTAHFEPENDVIGNLQVNNTVNFSREGMPNLFQRINDIKDWKAGGGQNLAINITGGYGATLPYLTIFAQLEDVPLYYNFEDQDELITIPQVPLAIDSNLMDRHAGVLAQIADRIDDSLRWRAFKSQNKSAVRELDAFIWEDNDLGAELSPMGNIFWNDYLKSHFIVKLPSFMNRAANDEVIRELYERLNRALCPSYLTPDSCYQRLRELGHNDDLNHTGQVRGQDIFIFKSTDQDQVRLMYSFVVNGRTITQITIFDRRGHIETEQYIIWKNEFENLPEMNFETYTFDI